MQKEALKKELTNEEAKKGLEDAEELIPDTSASEEVSKDDNNKKFLSRFYVDFDMKEFTLFDKTVMEDNTAYWLSSCGYTEVENALQKTQYGYVLKTKRGIDIMSEWNDYSIAPYFCWIDSYNENYTTQINIGLYIDDYEQVLDSIFDEPIERGNSLEEVLSLIHYDGEIPTYPEDKKGATLDDSSIIMYQKVGNENERTLTISKDGVMLMVVFIDDVVDHMFIDIH